MSITPDFYRAVPSQFSQGDIFDTAPHAYLKDLPVPLRRITLPGNRAGFESMDAAIGVKSFPIGQSFLIPASCDLARAVLMTFDCEIDKPGLKYLSVALVRSLRPLPETQKDLIRQNRSFAFFYLPAFEGAADEFYVDFRRLSTLAPSLLIGANRISSLSDTAWAALVFQYIRFVTRYEIDPAILKRPS